jgi:hypothetical protein
MIVETCWNGGGGGGGGDASIAHKTPMKMGMTIHTFYLYSISHF